VTLTALISGMLLAACSERRVPEIERAAEFCGVSYSEMRDAYGTFPTRSPQTYVLGRCEIYKDTVGRVTTRVLHPSDR
jgi:hypothetical protein